MQRMPWASSSTGADSKGRPKRHRLPIEVVKITTAGPLAETFERERDRMYREITGADDESHDASVTPGAEKKMTGRVYETP